MMGSVVARTEGDVDRLRRELEPRTELDVRKLARGQVHTGATAVRPDAITLHTRSRGMIQAGLEAVKWLELRRRAGSREDLEDGKRPSDLNYCKAEDNPARLSCAKIFTA